MLRAVIAKRLKEWFEQCTGIAWQAFFTLLRQIG